MTEREERTFRELEEAGLFKAIHRLIRRSVRMTKDSVIGTGVTYDDYLKRWKKSLSGDGMVIKNDIRLAIVCDIVCEYAEKCIWEKGDVRMVFPDKEMEKRINLVYAFVKSLTNDELIEYIKGSNRIVA